MKHFQINMLKTIIYVLAVLFILIWLSSFVPIGFEFVSYILMFLLFIGGVALIVLTFKSNATGKLRGFLLFTGFSATILIVSIVIGIFEFKGYYRFYEIFKDLLLTEIDLFVVTVLVFAGLFLIGAIGSIVLFRKKGGRHSA